MKIKRFDVLQEAFLRGLVEKNSDLWREYYWNKTGMEGENEVAEWLSAKLPDGVVILRDLNLECKGKTQVDFLVLADNFWWLIEVKNYNGVFKCQNQICYLRGEQMTGNQLDAMQNRVRVVENIAKEINKNIQVLSSMIFIHPNCEVECDEIMAFDIVLRHQFNRKIQMVRSQVNLQSDRYIPAYLKALSVYFDQHHDIFPVFENERWQQLIIGCRCPECGSYDQVASHKQINCSTCGHGMNKSAAAKDIFKQFSLLYYQQLESIRIKYLMDLSMNMIGRSTFYKVMDDYKIKQGRGRSSKYYDYYSDKLNQSPRLDEE